MKDVPRVIYPLVDLEFGFDEMSSLSGGQQLNDLSTYGDGIVILYGSVESFTQDVADIHISRQGTPGRGAIFGLYGEPAAIGGDEVLIEVLGGLVVIVDAPEPQFRDQAVLKGTMDSFCSASGLWGVGKDQPNAQFIHGSLKLGGFCIVLQSMSPPMASGGEVGGSIQVKRLGKTMGAEHLKTYSEAPGEVLLILEESPQGFSCGIVSAQDKG